MHGEVMNLSQRVKALASPKSLLPTLAAVVALSLVMMGGIVPRMQAISGGLLPLDIRLSYSMDDVNELFDALGADGRTLYAQMHIVDMIYPLAYSLALVLGIAFFLGKRDAEGSSETPFILFPLVPAVFDYIENILIGTQLASHPALSGAIIGAASAATTVKWITLAISLGLLLLSFGLWQAARRERR